MSRFIRGLPGHPTHPPLTDATIGMYVLAAGLAVIGAAGAITAAAGRAMWLALVGGLIVSIPTALTGLADWLTIELGSPRWRAGVLTVGGWLGGSLVFVHGTRVQEVRQ